MSLSSEPYFANLERSYPPKVILPGSSGLFDKYILNIGLIKFFPPTPPKSAIYSTNAGILFTSLIGLRPTIPLNLSLSISEASSTARKVAPLKHYF